MITSDLVAFAARAVLGHRLRSALSLVGVAIGVASVIVLTALGEGARLYVMGEFAQLGTNLLVVLPGKTETTGAVPLFGGAAHPLTLDDAQQLARRVPQLRRVVPLSLGEAEARYRDRARQVTLIGSTPDLLGVWHLQVRTGRFLPGGDPREGDRTCVIGAQLQADLFRGANPLGEILHVGGERFRVIGVLGAKGTSMGMKVDEIVVLPVSQALRMLNQDGLFRIMGEVTTHEEIPSARAATIATLTARHGEEDITVITHDAVLGAFDKILSVLVAAIAGIAAISLGVAGIAIMNVMLVSVSERTSEVGLLKALGVTRRQVVVVFLLEAALLSLAGGLAGLLIGLGGVQVVRGLWPKFPATPPGWAILAALVVSLSVGLLFGALPARRAARLEPVAALTRR